jgi:hypothetical protein
MKMKQEARCLLGKVCVFFFEKWQQYQRTVVYSFQPYELWFVFMYIVIADSCYYICEVKAEKTDWEC